MWGRHGKSNINRDLVILEYAVQLYWEQISRGRFFIHEHPATASSWGLAMIKELERHPGVQVVTGDMCRWGMTLEKDISTDHQ